jgi:hypothetical protein
MISPATRRKNFSTSDFGDKNMKNIESIGDELNRTLKMMLDSGEAANIEEAQRIFEGFRLQIHIGKDISSSASLQAALLTAVNTGRRCFLGGVTVVGKADVDLLIPWRRCRTLREAILDLQGETSEVVDDDSPQVFIGDADLEIPINEFAVRATFDGWRGGIVPMEDNVRLDERQEFTPAGVLAGSLAVSEAFQFVRGRNAFAGRRSVGLSLWRPDSEVSWLEEKDTAPVLDILPSRLWLIGLGHLGQAYLWTLGFLPYSNPGDVSLVLHDFDTLVTANDSTSPLTDKKIVGRKKTRAMADWCEERGFRTSINERPFAPNFKIDGDEPRIALCGVDNEKARAALEDVGFAKIIEAGLGKGAEEYLAFQLHSFPGGKRARQIWGNSPKTISQPLALEKPAYQTLAAEGLDKCGLTLLADRSVGASFVGTFTSSLVIAELLRTVMGEHSYEVIDGTLRSLENRSALSIQKQFPPFNAGFTRSKLKAG